MKVLIITNLFPNNMQPGKGIFNKHQFKALQKFCDIRIVSPLAWFPLMPKKTQSFIKRIVDEETIDGINVVHPRYFMVSKIGRYIHGYLYYWGIKKSVERIRKEFSFDAVFATWAYPDAFAGVIVAKKYDCPLIVKVHGTDINVLPNYYWQKKMIQSSLNFADKIISVSRLLKVKMEALGIKGEKIELISNGVDKAIFKPMNQKDCRKKLSLSNAHQHILFVGNLVPIKGIRYLVEAMKDVPGDYILHVIGEGTEFQLLQDKINEWNISKKIIFHGRVDHPMIPEWLNAVDVLCLPSLNEGCPNVVLESLSCQTPVVGTNVGAIPDFVDDDSKGRIVEPLNAQLLAKAIQDVIQNKSDKNSAMDQKINSWHDNAQKVNDIIGEVCLS